MENPGKLQWNQNKTKRTHTHPCRCDVTQAGCVFVYYIVVDETFRTCYSTASHQADQILICFDPMKTPIER